jgi:hypothetical protein
MIWTSQGRCPVGSQNADALQRLIRSVVSSMLPFLVTIGILVICRHYGVIARADALSLVLLAFAAGGFIYLRAGLRNLPRARWRDFSTADLIAVIFFVPPCAISWVGILGGSGVSYPWYLIAGLCVVLHVSYVQEVFLRIPAGVERLRELIFAEELTEDALKQEYDLRRHRAGLCECHGYPRRQRYSRKRKSGKRYKSVARSAAVRRRRRRLSESAGPIESFFRSVLDAYSDSSTWLAATLASAGLFASLPSVSSPELAAALFVLSPFFLIPGVHYLRKRVNRVAGELD